MKKLLLIALVLVNASLMAMLIDDAPSSKAVAQMRGGGDYVAITSKIDNDEDALYIINPATKMLFGVLTETSRRDADMKIFDARNLTRDFPLVDEQPDESDAKNDSRRRRR